MPIGFGVTVHRQVRKDGIEGVGVELGEQVAKVAGADDQFHVVATNQRTQESKLKVAREGGDRADAEDLAAVGGPILEHIEKILARAEDGLGVVERDPPSFGEDERFVLPVKKRLAETLFKTAELGAQRRLRKIQPRGSARQAPLVGDRAKISEMMVIQERHPILLLNRTILRKTSIGKNAWLSGNIRTPYESAAH